MTDSTTRDVVKSWLNGLPDAERAALIAEVTGTSSGGDEGGAPAGGGGERPPAPKKLTGIDDGKKLYESMHPPTNAQGNYHRTEHLPPETYLNA